MRERKRERERERERREGRKDKDGFGDISLTSEADKTERRCPYMFYRVAWPRERERER